MGFDSLFDKLEIADDEFDDFVIEARGRSRKHTLAGSGEVCMTQKVLSRGIHSADE
jgi:hypothetical protein